MPVDSLVLRIDEIDDRLDSDSDKERSDKERSDKERSEGRNTRGERKIDTTLFILYDHVHKEYLVRGSRRGNFTPYSFVCSTMADVRSFVEWAICIHNRVSYTLMNYNDLPFHSIEITYDYLAEHYDERQNEVVGYDNCKLKFNDSFLNNYLRILRNVYNRYERA